MSNKRSSLISRVKSSPFKTSLFQLSNEQKGDGASNSVRQFENKLGVGEASVFCGSSASPSTLYTTPRKTHTRDRSQAQTIPQASSLIDIFEDKFPAMPQKSSKRYNGEVCCFCRDSLQLTFPGEVVLPLLCEHLCHKNCFMMLLVPENTKKLPICSLCKVATNVLDKGVYINMINSIHASAKEPMLDNALATSEGGTYSQVITPVMLRNLSNPLPSTPINQVANNQFFTPPTSTQRTDYESVLYNPIITCTSEIYPIKLNGNYEISYVLNIKPPAIYRELDLQFNPSELQLKWKVSNRINQQLGLKGEFGNLVIFDKMKISIDGESWDYSRVYLFSDYLVIYNDNTLAGMISISNDLSAASLIDGILNLNLTESKLPELFLFNEFSPTITQKWCYMLHKLMDNEQPITNLFQFTSTCWLDYQYEMEIPQNLIRFNNLLLHGGELPNSYIAKILPYPQPLPLNIVVAVPLFNKTVLSDAAYLYWLQQLLHRIRATLNATDRLAIIFLGIDCLHKPLASGTFVGCIEAAWNGWVNLFNDINIVTNSFKSNSHELETTLEKCAELYPYIPLQENSINKLLVLSCGDYEGDNQIRSQFDMSKIKKISLSIVKIGSHLDVFGRLSIFSTFEHGNDPVLRFKTPEELLTSIDLLIKRIQRICLPHLTVELQTKNNIVFTSFERFGVMELTPDLLQKITFGGIVPNDERNLLITARLSDCYQYPDEVPIFTYRASWCDNKSIQETVYAKVNTIRSPVTPTRVTATTISEAPNAGSSDKSHSNSIYYLDIPLLPPLSPSRNASFAKRQAELLIIEHLREALAKKDASALKSCISVAYGLLRCISSAFENNKASRTTPPNINAIKNILELSAITGSSNLESHTYVNLLVCQLERIIPLFDNDLNKALDECYDLIYSLI